MPRWLILLFFTFLIIAVQPQCTAYQSTLNYILTGAMQLGTPTDTFAKDEYNVIVSGMGTYANIFSAFSITGLQAASALPYYSIVVDQVVFSNTNTVMKVLMDYYNVNRDTKSQWRKIKLAYIVVSPEFEGSTFGAYNGNSWVFATSVEVTPPLVNAAALTDTYFANTNAAGVCGYIDSFPKQFGTNCADGKVVAHYYIMGFRYDSVSDSAYQFRLSIRGGMGTSNNEVDFPFVIQTGTVPNGPRFTIEDQSGYLKKIKIGIVLTVIRDYATYPTQTAGNRQMFKYSGVYMPVSLYNTPVPITKTASQNLNFFDIGYNKYVMYGFSALWVQPGGYIDFDLSVKNLYSLQINSQTMLNNVQVSADFYSSEIDAACTSTLLERTQVRSEQYSSVPASIAGQQTMSKIAASNGILTQASNQYVWDINAFDTGVNTDTITMNIQLVYEALTAGKPHVLQLAFNQLAAGDLPTGWQYRYSLAVDGVTILTETITADATENDKITKLGRNIATTTSTIVITIVFTRNPSADMRFQLNFALFEVSRVYDSVSQCCSATCMPNTGLNVLTQPYTCVSCNQTNGMVFNSAKTQCQCLPGYYLISSVSQICSPCQAKLCDVCNPSSPTICLTCTTGATLQFPNDCVCNSGMVPVNNKCSACSYKCATCDATGKCLTCSDARRNLTNACACVDGYYDSLTAQCLPCSSSCKTCSSPSVCTSCDATLNKQLRDGFCLCATGYYGVADAMANVQCVKCQAQCDSCVGVAWNCTQCDPNKNKIQGIDTAGHTTCLCAPGFLQSADGSCVQTDCTKDPYCTQCSNDAIRICLACRTDINRVLDLTTYRCVCKQGFYATSTGECVACPTACATCSSGSSCISCVAGASRTGTLCSCPSNTFFTENPIRYCKGCQQNCVSCSSSGTCSQCLPTFTLTSDGKCICGTGKFVNSQNQCTSCSSPTCATCRTPSVCLTCISGYLLEQGSCISHCSEGYYRSGQQCISCPSGCSLCSSEGQCQACNPGISLYQGKCYSTCPLGTLNEQSTGKCIPCNAPCKTCIVHPSRCTSCDGVSTLVDGNCVNQCSIGTFESNGVCLPCDFSCAACLGNARVCTACPQGQYLYNSACYDYCPKFDSSGKCLASCPAGYYQSSNAVCSQCPSTCQQCSSPSQCTVCASNLFSYMSQCLISCPTGTYATSAKQCAACDASCKSCQSLPTSCTQCASGYVLNPRTRTCSINNIPQCTSNQFYNQRQNRCQSCSTQCRTCTDASTCTSCVNGQVPVRGRCTIVSTCPANCSQCQGTDCTACNFGFYLNNKQCVATCPYPLNAVNGQCACSSGILHQNTCVTSCPSGFTAIAGQCQQCQSNCKQCSQRSQYCTSCPTGFQLNPNTKTCQVSNTQVTTCPIGQYLDNNKCNRYCASNMVYQNGLCYMSCLANYVDNGQGGCQLKSSTILPCPTGQYLSNGQCQGFCPQSFFGNKATGRCQACPSNCNECVSSVICTSCASLYTLNAQALCQLKSTSLCSSSQFQLNGSCYNICPVNYFGNKVSGKCEACSANCAICTSSSQCVACVSSSYTINAQGGCSLKTTTSACPSGQFQLNTFCFSLCPSGYFANTATQRCQQCPSNCTQCSSSSTCTACLPTFVLRSGSCLTPSPSTTCNPGYYMNATQNLCYPCQSPCATCSDQTKCLSCVSGFTLSGSNCVSTSCSDGYFKDQANYCQACVSPCKTCVSASECTSCVSGYSLSAGRCTVASGNLVQLSGIQVQSAYKRGSSVIISMLLPVIPSNLTPDQKSRFFSVKQSNLVNTIVSVTQWLPDSNSKRVMVMVNFASLQGSSFLFLSVNYNVMSSAYANLGYAINDKSYKAVSVYQTMQDAPASIQIPISATAVPYAVLSN